MSAVTLIVDGEPVEALEGQSVAAALLGAGYRFLRRSPREGAPRGAFCMMGVCQECRVRIGGEMVQSCLAEVADGMVVRLDRGP